MQTFMPFVSFTLVANCLDRQRLGKQRVEAKQIYLAITDPTYGWQNHPAVKMWRGHTEVLALYGQIMCMEWRARGYNDTLLPWFRDKVTGAPLNDPPWISNEAFRRAHQSNLVRKDPDHYRKFFPDVPDNLPYIWPVK